MKNTKHMVFNWNGCDFRFVNKCGQWWLILKDLSDVLGIRYEDARNNVSLWHGILVHNFVGDRPTLGVDCCGMYSVAIKTPYIEDDSALLSWLDMVFYYLERFDGDEEVPEYISAPVSIGKAVTRD